MGREVRRVPLDFDWPLRQTWEGYLRDCDNFECDECDECRSIHPPEGEGWQLWETTSEGSPISPVFADGEALAQWMSVNPCGFAGSAISLEAARRFINGPGWAPSMIYSPATGLVDGITATPEPRESR